MENTTFIPSALVERPDLVAKACDRKMESGLNWRGLESSLGVYGLSGGSAGDYRSIVQWFAAIERRRVETGSYQ